LTWVDERIDGSNQALANARGMSADRVLPMVTGLSLDADLDRFTRSFETEWGGLDVVLLGVGPDGHIASIFPGHPGLEETGIAFTLGDSPKPPAERMSLTLPVLEDVELSVVLARGAGKAATLARAFAADPSLPLGRYRPRAAVHWILDPQAAGELS
jgi:6-phosphogluconolactonase